VKIADYEKRKIICQECEYCKQALEIGDKKILFICKKCGCLLNIKWNFKFFKCPLDKWTKTN
jgi:hypothetical protein